MRNEVEVQQRNIKVNKVNQERVLLKERNKAQIKGKLKVKIQIKEEVNKQQIKASERLLRRM